MLLLLLLGYLFLMCKADGKCIDTYFWSFAAANKGNTSLSLPYTEPLAMLMCT